MKLANACNLVSLTPPCATSEEERDTSAISSMISHASNVYLCSSAKREFSIRIRVVLLMSKLLDTLIRVSCE